MNPPHPTRESGPKMSKLQIFHVVGLRMLAVNEGVRRKLPMRVETSKAKNY